VNDYVVKFLYSHTMSCAVTAANREQAIQIADAQADRTGVQIRTYVRQFDVGSMKSNDPRLLKPDADDMGNFQYLLIEGDG